ncbi:MAG: universal stress protein [Gemmatimonadales bacterium]
MASRTPAKRGGPRLRRLVVATDFSLEGGRAVRRAATLPLGSRGQVVLIHVLPAKLDVSVDSVVRGAAEVSLADIAKGMRRMFSARKRNDVTVESKVVKGHAATEIDRLALALSADLVVIGRRGHAPVRDAMLGSTARRLLRHGQYPVLAVGPAPKAPYKMGVLGFDFSAEARRAARLLAAVMPPTGKVLAVHTYEDPLKGLPPSLAEHVGEADHTAKLKERGRLLRRAVDGTSPRASDWQLRLEAGDPRELLLEAVRSKHAEIIAVGPTGKRPLQRTLIGSVAEYVLNRAPCDVLLARRAV